MTFTPEQLRMFAEVGGWKFEKTLCLEHMVHAHSPHNPNKTVTALPNFPNDLTACFEVLEYVTDDYDLKRRNGSAFVCTIYKPSCEWIELGSTKQAAIIAAVLAAKEAHDRH